jgi:hypothetical protein
MQRKTGREQTILRTQREVLRDVMLSAAERQAWQTLQELARLTRYGEASISAQLRHLRKPQFGGFVLEKRQRHGQVVSAEEHGTVWEYRLDPIKRRKVARHRRTLR